ncbi:MAG TPA: hypothetical protein VMU41_01800 [Candidatus Binataceae bacterium]|nr:hypothetical protein [Candidatus Binataceae bacterium]
MRHKLALLLAVAVSAAPLIGCKGEQKAAVFDPRLAGQFFPLQPQAEWTYRVKSESQQSTYAITDTVIGEKYVPSLNLTGEVVSEYYDMDRGGTRPILYVSDKGYFDRLSGLDYSQDSPQQSIVAPAWGRSEDGSFLPQQLSPNLSWSSKSFPFGHVQGAFDIKQAHKTYLEPEDVVVPAGHFSNCIRVETLAQFEGGEYAKKDKPSRLTYEDWYAPKIGLVKTITYEGGINGHEMERVELIHFKVPPDASAQGPSTSQSAASRQTSSAVPAAPTTAVQ